THSHSDGTAFTLDQWTGEIQMCLDWLTKPFDAAAVGTDMSKGIGVPRAEIIGFRTPFLAYNDNTFAAVKNLGFHYDCTLFGDDSTDMNELASQWTYPPDAGSPADPAVKSRPG